MTLLINLPPAEKIGNGVWRTPVAVIGAGLKKSGERTLTLELSIPRSCTRDGLAVMLSTGSKVLSMVSLAD